MERIAEKQKRAKEEAEASKQWFEMKQNTSVYVTGLPDDVTPEEMAEVYICTIYLIYSDIWLALIIFRQKWQTILHVECYRASVTRIIAFGRHYVKALNVALLRPGVCQVRHHKAGGGRQAAVEDLPRQGERAAQRRRPRNLPQGALSAAPHQTWRDAWSFTQCISIGKIIASLLKKRIGSRIRGMLINTSPTSVSTCCRTEVGSIFYIRI